MDEVWMPIPGYEGIYEASNIGRIRTCEGKTTHSVLHGVRHWRQRYLKFKTEKGEGYRQDFRVTLWKDKKPRCFLVARLICAAFHGKPSNKKMTVDHLNGNYQDNRSENLEWVTREENTIRAHECGANDNRKTVLITDKATGEQRLIVGMGNASKILGMNIGYVSYIVKNKNGETDTHIITLVDNQHHN